MDVGARDFWGSRGKRGGGGSLVSGFRVGFWLVALKVVEH